ncbi:response regulator transcription factor [Erysipelothrix sp. HDW6C]|uniref:response regulator transcription factor n=1 Tax=Erysipelothrix sp. HDW6C TaxID=2714930 RepID=UPI00140C1722|nr:response regulator transcription factor [Erysipelothrix sp. HDW6C]QIK70819.1 response regulator transcription factor [Erysipelothrix sp. HDW6C]
MINILYLEDEANIRDVTHEYLIMKQYNVDLAVDGNEALALLATHSYDIAILDIMVPYVSGLEVLTKISESHPNTATIMLTALGDETNQIEAFNRHADDYMIKPFSPLLLLKRIEAILRRVGSAVQETGLVVKNESYQVYYNQKSLNLTVTEFLLYQIMASYPGRVYTREQLLDVIAPDDYMVSDRVVDAHVKNLRKKLPLPVIKTVVGIGYQFVEVDHEVIA